MILSVNYFVVENGQFSQRTLLQLMSELSCSQLDLGKKWELFSCCIVSKTVAELQRYIPLLGISPCNKFALSMIELEICSFDCFGAITKHWIRKLPGYCGFWHWSLKASQPWYCNMDFNYNNLQSGIANSSLHLQESCIIMDILCDFTKSSRLYHFCRGCTF